MVNYRIDEDVKLIRELLNLSQKQFAEKIGVDIEKIYTFAFNNNIFINEIKAQLYYEDLTNENKLVLYHGAKNIIDGNIDIEHSKNNNDFGKGFYCGESFEQ